MGPFPCRLAEKFGRGDGPIRFAARAEQPKPEEILREQLPLIDGVVRSVCRRRAFSADDSEEFQSFVHLKLTEDNYRILRKFEGRCSLRTYMTITVGRLALDFRDRKWGKWRPSAVARRLGKTAVALDTLMYRDQLGFEEAASLLMTRDPALTRADLEKTASELPVRWRRRFEPAEVLANRTAEEPGPDQLLETREKDRLRAKLWTRLEEELESLPAEDRLVVQWRFLDGMQVVRIAELLQTEAKPLYARIQRILTDLRQRLESAGFSAEEVVFWLEK